MNKQSSLKCIDQKTALQDKRWLCVFAEGGEAFHKLSSAVWSFLFYFFVVFVFLLCLCLKKESSAVGVAELRGGS